MLDINKLRRDTPGVEKVIHLNNAGSSLIPIPVMQAMVEYQNDEMHRGGYETAALFHKKIQSFYENAGKLLNAEDDEIAFTDSATTSWQRVFFSINWKNGDEIITGNAEYASNYLAFLRLKKQVAITIRVARDNPYGETEPAAVEALINSKTKLIAITHMPTISGLVNQVEEIGKVAKKHGILYLVDACQSVGQYPLDVDKIGCDFLSGTGRKFLRGPRGTGLLYVRREALNELDPMSLDLFSGQWSATNEYKLRNSALRFETFERNYAGMVGLSAAIAYQNELDINSTWERIQKLAEYLRKEVSKIPGIQVVDKGRVKSGIVTITTPESPLKLMHDLNEFQINTSPGSIVNSRLYMEKNQLSEVLRVSVHYYNTEEELDIFCSKLKEIL